MCGIAATFAYGGAAPPVDRDELIRIRDRMAHRGPDGEGIWISEDQRVGLAHRRLSIIDLSEAGAQPMWNVERTLCITFNGEIYNYEALRNQLLARDHRFHSHCDTEVILQLYAEKGAAMLNDLRGMYAFAIWDARKRTLFAARDPFGIKPLYYADNGRTLYLASQVKAILASKHIDQTPEAAAHVGFFVWGSVPDPFTLYRNIKALGAGETLTLRENGSASIRQFASIPSILAEAEQGHSGDTHAPEQQRALLHDLLRQSTKAHLVADVPVGVFLSAGLDSSTLTALVSEAHSEVRTVTLGFEEFRGTSSDETRLAEIVANQYGTHHDTIWITRRDFEENARQLFASMDRPSIDGVNTYFVSLAARRAGLKVALSGLGGDELFGGYSSFHDIPRLVRWFRHTGHASLFGRGFRVITAPVLKRFTSPKYAGIFEYGSSYPGAYLLRRALFMPWELPELLDPDLVREGWQRLHTMSELGQICHGLSSPRARVSALELCWYMRHQLLRDSDWAGMGHSLEIRVPFVDITLFAQLAPLVVSAMPPSKGDMASTPRTALPREVLERPKTGFTVPVRDWLLQSFDPTPGRERGLRGWAREVYSRFADPLVMHAATLKRRRAATSDKLQVEAHGRRDYSPDGGASNFSLSTTPTSARITALVLVSDAFGGVGGIAKFNRDLLNALCGDERIGEVVVAPRLMPRPPETSPEKLRTLTTALGGKLAFINAVRREARSLRRRGDRVIIFCGHINLLPAAALAKRISRGTLHLIVHGIDAWKPVYDPAVRGSLRLIDGFIAVSRVTKQRFESWSRFRTDDGTVLPNSIDLARFTPGPKSPRLIGRYGLEGRTVIMTFGRLESAERYKGFDEVLDVLPRLSREFNQIAYLICGDGPDRPRLVAKAKSLGCDVVEANEGKVERKSEKGEEETGSGEATHPEPSTSRPAKPRVVFAGSISEEEKVDHYRLADLYVMPSYGEGFGIVYLEALACGIPVIGSKADGSRDALRDGLLGTLVDPRDRKEITEAILSALSTNGHVRTRPPGLEYFSRERFDQRVHQIIDVIAGDRVES